VGFRVKGLEMKIHCAWVKELVFEIIYTVGAGTPSCLCAGVAAQELRLDQLLLLRHALPDGAIRRALARRGGGAGGRGGCRAARGRCVHGARGAVPPARHRIVVASFTHRRLAL